MIYLNSLFILLQVLSIFYFQIGKVEGIIGGNDADIGKFTYTVSVQENNVHVCGGAIVGVRTIVTAAQCVIQADNHFKDVIFSVVARTVDLKDPRFEQSKIRVFVSKIFVPSEFKHIQPGEPLGSHFDSGNIAVLELKEKLPLESGSLDVLLFPKKSAHVSRYTHESAILTGFGIEDLSQIQNDYHKSVACSKCHKLKYATLNIVDKKSCKRTISQIIHNKHLCAQMNQRSMQLEGACEGDIGSPLVLHGMTLIGILMRTNWACSEREHAAIYTKVAPFVNFIEEAMLGEIKDKRTSRTEHRVAYYRKKDDGTEYLQEFMNYV